MKTNEEKVLKTNSKPITTKQTKPEKQTKPAEKPVKKAASKKNIKRKS